MFPFHQLQGAVISGKIQPSKTNNEKENQEEKIIDAGLNRMTEEEVEGTESPDHLPKPTRTRHTQSRSVPPRETRQSETDSSHRDRSPYKKGLTSSSNFELTIDSGHIYLFHRGKKVIDLSNPKKQVFHNSVTFKLERNSLKIINSSGHTQRSYDGVKNLITFDGRHISEHGGAMVQVFVSKGQLFVSKDKAFYSSSEQLNMLLNDQLARVIPHLPDTILMFQTLPSGDLMLVVDGEPVINLSGAEVKEIPISCFVRYLNGTIYVHHVSEQRVKKVYSGVDQFYVLNGIGPGLEKHKKIVSGLQISGGGRLYVHTNSGAAFYSRNRQINTAIDEHITHRLSEPPRNLVFTIQFENSSDNQNDENLEIVLSMNGDEIFHFNPRDTEDQSLTLRHSLKYINETLFILEDNYDVAGGFIDVKELLVFDGITTSVYKGSAQGMVFAGGGQVFNSGARAFYSLNTNLNDQIGEAILATK